MASKYLIAAGGNWDSDSSWSTTSGGANDTTKPTAADDVFLDASSGQGTINAAAVCRSINCTGYTGTLTQNSSTTLTIGDATAGASNIALKFVAGMTYTLGSINTSQIQFVSTSTTQQSIDFAGKSAGPVTWNGSTGSWILSSAFTSASSNVVCTFTSGTLNTNNQTISCHGFAGANANTRTLTLGSSTITCTGGGFTAFNLATTTNLTFTANTANINVTGTGAIFNGGNLTFGGTIVLSGGGTQTVNSSGVIEAVTRTGGNLSVPTSCQINTLTFQSEAAARSCSLNSGITLTIPTAAGWLVNGSSEKLISIISSSAGTPATISIASGTLETDYLSIKDSTATGGATFNAGDNSINVSGNSGWIFPVTSVDVGTMTNQEAEYMFLAGQNGVYSGSINEQRIRFYNSESGARETSLQSSEIAFLKSKTGMTSENPADMWRVYLGGLGISQSQELNDMKRTWWSSGDV